MSLAIVHSRAEQGISAQDISVEVHLSGGLPCFSMVGLPEAAVRESRDRVRSALIACNFEFPRKRITVNLAPADLPKEGGRYDLPIAIGVLAAAGMIPKSALQNKVFIGELALSGALRKIHGALVTALSLRDTGQQLCLPQQNAQEAAVVPGVELLPATHLLDVVAGLCGQTSFEHVSPVTEISDRQLNDIRDIKGQLLPKQALIIAAAGGHNLLLFGPPGTGKSMLAARLIGLLPDLSIEQALESAAVASISNQGLEISNWLSPPFRRPHHSASAVSMVGGGGKAAPGEISLAHNGVLFLDEFPEFDRKVLENMREPLESGEVSIARAAYRVTFPARFLLVAAMNPCSCGYRGDSTNPQRCRCTPDQVARYRGRLSGPLLDRIDMHVEVPRVPQAVLSAPARSDEPGSEQLREKITSVREKQIKRQGVINSELQAAEIEEVCALNESSRTLLDRAMNQLGLSARAYHRILKLARSIADLAESEQIEQTHLAQAIQFRTLDRSP